MYVIFEGPDFSGKTTTMHSVAEELRKKLSNINILETHHPGSTPLGKHLRKLVKNPESIDPDIVLDPLSRQLLYIADAVSFTKSILEPSLASGEVVLADRSGLISSIIYGSVEGINLERIMKFNSIVSPPIADRVYILRCGFDIIKERAKNRNSIDYFDNKPDVFLQNIVNAYDNLLTGSIEVIMAITRSVQIKDVIYIDTSEPPCSVVDTITNDILGLYKDRIIRSRFENEIE